MSKRMSSSRDSLVEIVPMGEVEFGALSKGIDFSSHQHRLGSNGITASEFCIGLALDDNMTDFEKILELLSRPKNIVDNRVDVREALIVHAISHLGVARPLFSEKNGNAILRNGVAFKTSETNILHAATPSNWRDGGDSDVMKYVYTKWKSLDTAEYTPMIAMFDSKKIVPSIPNAPRNGTWLLPESPSERFVALTAMYYFWPKDFKA